MAAITVVRAGTMMMPHAHPRPKAVTLTNGTRTRKIPQMLAHAALTNGTLRVVDAIATIGKTEIPSRRSPAPTVLGSRKSHPRGVTGTTIASDDDDDAPINLEEADENTKREVAPRGKYHCRIDDAEFTTFKSGSKGAKIRLEVIDGDYAAGGTGPNGKRKKGLTFYTNLVVMASTAGLVKSALKAMGVDKKIYNSQDFRPSTLQRLCDEGDLIGAEVVADVKVGNYEGDKNNQVQRIMAPGDAGDKAEGKGGFLED
jgi:hypothetical protein